MFSGIAALIALAMVFAGCAQPTDMNITTDGVTTLVKLDNPVVHVTAYDGFNVVSWEPVRDANSYEVWRLDTQSSSQIWLDTLVTASPADDDLSIVDNAGDSDPVQKLANGRTYKYIVIASPNTARVGTDDGTSAGTLAVTDAHYDIYSGRGEATVTAKVPDPATYKVPKASDIKYRVDPNGYLFVSWTQPANATAQIGYFIGGYPADAALPTMTSPITAPYTDFAGIALFDLSGAGYLYPKNAVTRSFPIIGGKVTIAIQTSYFNGAMYAADRPATLDITLDQYNLDLQWITSPTFTATHIYKDATTGTVQLSWSRIQGDDDVYSSTTYSTSASNKVTYNVYKREIAVNADSIGSATGLTGNWTKVNYTFSDPSSDHTANQISTIYAVETGDVKSTLSTWQYIVYASASRGGKTNHSYPLTTSLARTLPAEATISASVAYGGSSTTDDGQVYTNRISVSGVAAGVSYKIYRGELTPILINYNGAWALPSNANYQFTAYDATPIEEWEGKQVFGDTTAAFTDSNIVARKTYIYKLVSYIPGATEKDNIFLGDGSTDAVYPGSTTDFASVYSSLNLGVAALLPVTEAGVQTNDTQRGWIRATLNNRTGYTAGVDAKLFYRRAQASTPGVTVTEWTELAPFEKYTQTGGANSQITDKNGIFRPLEYKLPDPVAYGETYQFKAVAYLGGKEMPNLSQITYSGAAINNFTDTYAITSGLSQAALDASAWSSASLSFTNLGAQPITGITGDFLNGASVDVRVIRNTPRLDEPGKPGQPTYYDQGAVTFTRSSTAGQYQTSLTWASIPAENGNTSLSPAGQDIFTVVYKYEWEKWEAQTDAWWRSNRQIGSTLTR